MPGRDEQVRLTTAAELRGRAAEPVVTELPSGATVTVRRIAALDLVRAGHLPDHLTQHVFEELDAITIGLDDVKDKARTYRERAEAIDAVTCALLVEPRCVPADERDDAGAIHPADLDMQDRLFLWQVALGQQRLAERAARFRGEGPQDSTPPTPAREGVRPPTE